MFSRSLEISTKKGSERYEWEECGHSAWPMCKYGPSFPFLLRDSPDGVLLCPRAHVKLG